MKYINVGNIKVNEQLYDLVEQEIAPGTGFDAEMFFGKLGALVGTYAARNRELLDKRRELQSNIDDWHAKNPVYDSAACFAFLEKIGYVQKQPKDFTVSTSGVDAEIAQISGPQLVVPVDNARYALNAANARWGSLFDALYGTDMIPQTGNMAAGKGYNKTRGAAVIAYANAFLDQAVPLAEGKWEAISGFGLREEAGRTELCVMFPDGTQAGLKADSAFAGYEAMSNGDVKEIVLKNNGLHIIPQIDREHKIGQQHRAGIKDVVLEAAITTIQDCEDSVAAVDTADKCRVYANWNGLMRGDLRFSFDKGGERIERALNPDRDYTAPDGSALTLHGRSLMLVRNVGMHMYTDAVLDSAGNPIPEAFLDLMVTVLSTFHDKGKNSRTGSVYIVKPKMHGPEEVAFNCELFSAAEKALGLKKNTLKIGIMDEEQRTTLNLKACVQAARERVAFINTGFLDRTGDLIHTHMRAGVFAPKHAMKDALWMSTYEAHNVNVGLATGVDKVGQIGKGMYAKPEEMQEMVATKAAHPKAGANCAWVPSPTAATLHALHYHQIDVAAVQDSLRGRKEATLSTIISMPLLHEKLTPAHKDALLQEYCQSILGYVVRWVNQGVGCSSVPNIADVKLMEDRATLRIGSQLLANWLLHGVVALEEIKAAYLAVAPKVDAQNAGDPLYTPIGKAGFNNTAMQTSLELVTNGTAIENGYVEYSLHKGRKLVIGGQRSAVSGSVRTSRI